jgi:NADH:ubiquinone oxidoreductase subunit 4 (subunit M)
MLLLIVALGLYPQLLFKMTDLPVTHLVNGLSRAL